MTENTTLPPELPAAYRTHDMGRTEKKAILGFVLGLAAIVAWIIPLIGFPVTIAGAVQSYKGLPSQKFAFAFTGLLLNLFFLVLTGINSFIGVLMAAGGAQ